MSTNITCSGYSGVHGGLASLHNSYVQAGHTGHYKGS